MAGVLSAEARRKLEKAAAAHAGIAAEVLVETGDPLTTIHAVAEETGADLLVMGVHRRRPLADVFAGTTMERVVRLSLRPVLLVSRPAGQPYRTALCGLDLSAASAAAARAVARLCPDAAIETMHAVHVPFQGFMPSAGTAGAVDSYTRAAREALEDWLKTADLPEQCRAPKIVPDSLRPAFERMLADVDPDLVAIGAHGRPSLSPSYLGSFAEELLRDPPSDILIVRR